MAHAASLVATGAPETQSPVYDTEDTVAGARIAAERALGRGARLLLGPLRAEQTPTVVAIAGDVPVVSFSNDDRLTEAGAFVMGITPAQSVAAAFSYARAQGATRVALIARPGPLGEASRLAARQLAEAGGLTLTAALLVSGPGGIADALRGAGGGRLPDAVFLPDGGAALAGFAEALRGQGVQLMGGVQWGLADVAAEPALAGAWFAAPPPERFVPFRDLFEMRFTGEAGVVTALGHDAALLAAELGSTGDLDRAGLTRAAGFGGVLGAFRFLETGRCLRDLAMLTVEGGEILTIGEIAGT